VGHGRGDRRQPAGSPPGELKDSIIDRRSGEARNIAKVAAARKLLTCVLCAMRDGEVRSLAPRSAAEAARAGPDTGSA
jgi:hypothetical protein